MKKPKYSVEAMSEELNLSIDQVSNTVALSYLEMRFALFREYRCFPDSPLHSRFYEAMKSKSTKGFTHEAASSDFAASLGMSRPTLTRALKGKDIKGYNIIKTACKLKEPFCRFASLLNPEEKALTGPKAEGKALRRMRTDKKIKILFAPFPPLWNRDSSGLFGEAFCEIFERAGIKPIPVPIDVAIATEIFLESDGAGDVLFTIFSANLQCQKLQLVKDLIAVKVNMMISVKSDPRILCGGMFQRFDSKILAFRFGFVEAELKRLHVPDELISTLSFETPGLLGPEVRDGNVIAAIADRYSLEKETKCLKDFILGEDLTSGYCSMFVRHGEKALANELTRMFTHVSDGVLRKLDKIHQQYASYYRILIR